MPHEIALLPSLHLLSGCADVKRILQVSVAGPVGFDHDAAKDFATLVRARSKWMLSLPDNMLRLRARMKRDDGRRRFKCQAIPAFVAGRKDLDEFTVYISSQPSIQRKMTW